MLYTRPPEVEVYSGDPFASPCKAVVIPILQDASGKPIVTLDRTGRLSEAVSLELFKAEAGSLLETTAEGKITIYAGVGRGELEGVRRGVASGVKKVVERAECALVALSHLDHQAASEALLASLLAAYRLEAFRSSRGAKLKKVLIDRSDVDLRRAIAIAEGVYLARDIANAPPHEMPPARLAERAAELFKGLAEVEVFSYERLLKEGFGGIVNVGMGSEEKPVLIVVKYSGGEGKPVALVGKTVIFDSGGINIKPSEGMNYMRADKAGGAAVLGIIWSAARAGLRLNLVGLVPAVINVPSGSSYLPSDVIKMWDGTRVEVNNTDAEGRLIIGDAIAYAAKALDAAEIIDLATLTGAIVVALGPLIAGLFTRDERLREALLASAARTGEKLWHMPLEDDYKPWLTKNAQVGDLTNSAPSRAGAAIYAALFLERFAHGKPYAHLDIAGPGMGYEASGIAPAYWPDKGLAPGYGVRLIFEYLSSRG
ncbi:MAG: leucyl aminopeptidase family protein [Acidilobaceae archaeon]|nr:leucyl aminopeptidase family protein [Acidilobaceae archaeon]